MRINAYILAADPAWIEASVLSYYDMVNKIVVSHDDKSTSWTGTPIPVEECLSRLRAIDRDRKMIYSPGHYARLDHHPMENETYQRQCALDEAGKDADWVLQLDTDEVLMNLDIFKSCLNDAGAGKFAAMLYPARWLYQKVRNGIYLERCARFWRIQAGYPGPVAVRSGIKLRLARQCDVKTFRVDFSVNSDTPVPTGKSTVHRAVRLGQAIAHFSWVRSYEQMVAKSNSSGHAKDFDWKPEIRFWAWSASYPYLAFFLSPFRRASQIHWLRVTKICKNISIENSPAQEIRETITHAG
jgi:hypothetical protein